jgi:hypothetical protein
MNSGIDDQIAITIFDLACEVPGDRVKCIDGSIANIANEDVIAEGPEVGTGLCDLPRGRSKVRR